MDDIKEGPLDSEIWPAVYYPLNQAPDTYFALVVRTSQAEQSMLPTLVNTIHQIDPRMGTSDEATMNQRINDSQTAYLHRSSAWLVGGFASLALLLGVVGLYGVIAYSVEPENARDWRAHGVGRSARLGVQAHFDGGGMADRGRNCHRLSLLGGCGQADGQVCCLACAAWDALTLAAVAVVLAASALLASYIPAHRAASVNPLEALRAE